MVTGIETIFPGLAGKDYKITSPKDDKYNCIAWAALVTTDWWWPDTSQRGWWPSKVPRQATIDAFHMAFATVGFENCSTDEWEPGFEKIALFARDGVPQHAARQLATGRWTSKLGAMEDIEHDLRDLEGTLYGSVVLFMKRAKV